MTEDSARGRLIAVLGDPTAARNLDDRQWSGLIATARSANLLGALATWPYLPLRFFKLNAIASRMCSSQYSQL